MLQANPESGQPLVEIFRGSGAIDAQAQEHGMGFGMRNEGSKERPCQGSDSPGSSSSLREDVRRIPGCVILP